MTYEMFVNEQDRLKEILQAEIIRTARHLYIKSGKPILLRDEAIKIPEDLKTLRNKISSPYGGSPWMAVSYDIIEKLETKKENNASKEQKIIFELAQRITRKLFN